MTSLNQNNSGVKPQCDECGLDSWSCPIGECPVCGKSLCVRGPQMGCFYKVERHECQKLENVKQYKEDKGKITVFINGERSSAKV